MKTTRTQNLIAAALVCVLALLVGLTIPTKSARVRPACEST